MNSAVLGPTKGVVPAQSCLHFRSSEAFLNSVSERQGQENSITSHTCASSRRDRNVLLLQTEQLLAIEGLLSLSGSAPAGSVPKHPWGPLNGELVPLDICWKLLKCVLLGPPALSKLSYSIDFWTRHLTMGGPPVHKSKNVS